MVLLLLILVKKKRNFKEFLREHTKILDISIVDFSVHRKVDEIFATKFSAKLKKAIVRIGM